MTQPNRPFQYRSNDALLLLWLSGYRRGQSWLQERQPLTSDLHFGDTELAQAEIKRRGLTIKYNEETRIYEITNE